MQFIDFNEMTQCFKHSQAIYQIGSWEGQSSHPIFNFSKAKKMQVHCVYLFFSISQ
jgi:hypothetical protein